MCGRFAIYSSVKEIQNYANALNRIENWEKNYNAAPGNNIPVLVRENGKTVLKLLQWGLIPFWAKDEKIGYKLINARAETISEKPSFKYAFRKRRCLIPANGFYEWRKADKQPFYFRLRERELFVFAGIWEKWKSPAGKEISTCSIITTDANELVKPIHPRMPVILSREFEQNWLQENDENFLLSLLVPLDSKSLIGYPVSKAVNSTSNNFKGLIERE